MLLKELFERFIKERTYLDNVSPRTIEFLRQSWTAFERTLPDVTDSEQLAEPNLGLRFIGGLRDSGSLKPVSVNTYIRGINTFLSWLHREASVLNSRIAIRQLRVETTIPTTLSSDDLMRLIKYKPTCVSQRRVHTIAMTIIDTGLRVNEVITMRRDCVDMDAMVLRVMGKGRKERLVPFSAELRRLLYRWDASELTGTSSTSYLFPSRSGGLLMHRNLRRDYGVMLTRVGLSGVGAFHRLRHTFASAFVRNNGNAFHLQRILGHSDIRTTQIYVHTSVEDLRSPTLLNPGVRR
jgi:integrase/recombinase XerD